MHLLGPGWAAKHLGTVYQPTYIGVTMKNAGFRTTVSCRQRQPFTVGGRWFLAEDVVNSEGTREVCVVMRNEKWQHALTGFFLPQGKRHEMFPGVFVTFTDLSQKSRVKLLIEAPEGIPISRGYPRQVKPADMA